MEALLQGAQGVNLVQFLVRVVNDVSFVWAAPEKEQGGLASLVLPASPSPLALMCTEPPQSGYRLLELLSLWRYHLSDLCPTLFLPTPPQRVVVLEKHNQKDMVLISSGTIWRSNQSYFRTWSNLWSFYSPDIMFYLDGSVSQPVCLLSVRVSANCYTSEGRQRHWSGIECTLNEIHVFILSFLTGTFVVISLKGEKS